MRNSWCLFLFFTSCFFIQPAKGQVVGGDLDLPPDTTSVPYTTKKGKTTNLVEVSSSSYEPILKTAYQSAKEMNCYPNYREIEKLVQNIGLDKPKANNPDLYFKAGDIASQALQGLGVDQIILKFASLHAGLNSLEKKQKKLYGKGERSLLMGEWASFSEKIQSETKILEFWRHYKGFGNCKENAPSISFVIDDSMFIIKKERIDQLKKETDSIPLNISPFMTNMYCNDHLIYEDGDFVFEKKRLKNEKIIKEFFGAIRLIYDAAKEDNEKCIVIKDKGQAGFLAEEFILKRYFNWK